MSEVKSPNRIEIEHLILTSFPNCPFCGAKDMKFEWGHLVPKIILCQNCGASWEPLMSYDGNWTFVAARLISVDSQKKGTNLLKKMYSRDFWEKMLISSHEKWKSEQVTKEVPKEVTKTVIIREVVKIRCPYCGALYDEIKDRCPYCSGKR